MQSVLAAAEASAKAAVAAGDNPKSNIFVGALYCSFIPYFLHFVRVVIVSNLIY